jgi:hypothetical protein
MHGRAACNLLSRAKLSRKIATAIGANDYFANAVIYRRRGRGAFDDYERVSLDRAAPVLGDDQSGRRQN